MGKHPNVHFLGMNTTVGGENFLVKYNSRKETTKGKKGSKKKRDDREGDGVHAMCKPERL